MPAADEVDFDMSDEPGDLESEEDLESAEDEDLESEEDESDAEVEAAA
ncbi:MAG: DNA-directed RNA polymerase subunit delta, partial [Actinobacteria bacterium ATB1]|nr:DNA-directed RNA polymerase subunit delta [Actinobacteria bacterium ATB1]